MMFKPGDRVVCINNRYVSTELKLGKTYIVNSVGVKNGNLYIKIYIDTLLDFKYIASRFELTKSQIRKNKLKKINELYKI